MCLSIWGKDKLFFYQDESLSGESEGVVGTGIVIGGLWVVKG